MNEVLLIGHTGKDPEVRTLENGTKVANFTMATSERYTDRSGAKVTKTEWHNIVLWRGLAEIAEKYVSKGDHLAIKGKIETRSWEDKSGIKRYTTEIIGDKMEMLGQKPANNAQEPDPPNGNTNEPQEPEDDLPF